MDAPRLHLFEQDCLFAQQVFSVLFAGSGIGHVRNGQNNPDIAVVAVKGLDEFSDPTHPLHANYLSGCRDGSEHVRAVLASDEIIRNERFRSFRDFVTMHYL